MVQIDDSGWTGHVSSGIFPVLHFWTHTHTHRLYLLSQTTETIMFNALLILRNDVNEWDRVNN